LDLPIIGDESIATLLYGYKAKSMMKRIVAIKILASIATGWAHFGFKLRA
jgi:hypothetical protein